VAEVGVGGVVEAVEVEGGLEVFRVRRSVEGGLGGGDGGGGGVGAGAVGVSSAVSAISIWRARHGAGEGGFGSAGCGRRRGEEERGGWIFFLKKTLLCRYILFLFAIYQNYASGLVVGPFICICFGRGSNLLNLKTGINFGFFHILLPRVILGISHACGSHFC
jgi:hypothetical protein